MKLVDQAGFGHQLHAWLGAGELHDLSDLSEYCFAPHL